MLLDKYLTSNMHITDQNHLSCTVQSFCCWSMAMVAKVMAACVASSSVATTWFVVWASCKMGKLQVAHAPGMPGTFSPPHWVRDPDTHQGTCVRHVALCMPGSLTSGFLWRRWRGKRSRHSRRMRNPQLCTYRVRDPWTSPCYPREII